MSIKIKDEYFEVIVKGIENNLLGFDADGCACGTFEIKLNENLYMTCHRSCRKSSGTPDDKLWHIDDFEFYPKKQDDYEYPEEPKLLNVELDVIQSQILFEKLHSATKEIWGCEYRNEY